MRFSAVCHMLSSALSLEYDMTISERMLAEMPQQAWGSWTTALGSCKNNRRDEALLTLQPGIKLKQQEAKGWRKQAALQDLASKAENSHSNLTAHMTVRRGLRSTDFQRSLLIMRYHEPFPLQDSTGEKQLFLSIYHPANRRVLKKWRANNHTKRFRW